MSENRTSARGRVVRTRRSPNNSAAALAEIDRRLLDVLCTHRVVTQSQLQRLFPAVPERTLRYRTRRLHDLGLAGRSRPYRDQGSAPNHHWPTRRADCLMRGEPTPRGGERKQPNPVFLTHAAALTELYVAVATNARAIGVKGMGYQREGEARETFKDGMRERALAPDALLGLLDEHDRELWAFVEIDLGTMSHTRLRAKAELYAAYVASDAWCEHHAFLPALLFLTTTDIRARKFLNTLTHALSYGPHQPGRRAFVAGAAGIVWTPDHLFSERCFSDLDGHTGLGLFDVLHTARAPHERSLARDREQHEAEEERRRVLLDEPEAMREHMRANENRFSKYVEAFGENKPTLALLMASTEEPTAEERRLLGAIAHDLGDALPEPRMDCLPSKAAVLPALESLATRYHAAHTRLVDELAARYGEGPRLRQARRHVQAGALLGPITLTRLASYAERDAAAREEQQRRAAAYEAWRERSARYSARKAGPLGRLTHHAGDFYPQLDRQWLTRCRYCEETIYPEPGHIDIRYEDREKPRCHYCGIAYTKNPADEVHDPAAWHRREVHE